ncbi:MAG TPA: hypothetical protein PLW97_10855, partial [Synergistaceae bacterium]|nr:hypothetical protein [Synergistaceae bacterium]
KDTEAEDLTSSSYDKDTEAKCLILSSRNKRQEHGNNGSSPEEIVVLVREKKRAPRELVKSAILIICSQNYITAGKIANLTNRSVSNIRQHYIKPMLEEGLLERRFPQQPNHENQAYRTRSSGGNSHE